MADPVTQLVKKQVHKNNILPIVSHKNVYINVEPDAQFLIGVVQLCSFRPKKLQTFFELLWASKRCPIFGFQGKFIAKNLQ